MGKINKTLNRATFRTTNKRPFNHNKDYIQREQQRKENVTLKIINISEEQENRKDLKIIQKLPQTQREIEKALKQAESEDDKVLILQRIRDYYNPLVNPENEQQYNQFIVALLGYYIEKDIESKSLKSHLQELCSENGSLFSAYLKSKLSKIIQVIKEIKQNEKVDRISDESLTKILNQIVQCQFIVLKIFETPNNSKLLEILEQTTSYIYQLSNLFAKNNINLLLDIIEQDIAICYQLNKKFNPSITMILIKLVNGDLSDKLKKKLQKLYDKYANNFKDMPYASIFACELNKTLTEHSIKCSFRDDQFEYLQLQKKKPKELPSFAPFIDEDFLMFRDKKFKKKEDDDKEVKRKLKKAEKDALRELRKDTMVMQAQRQKEINFKNKLFRKGVVKAGAVKDEI